MEILVVLFLLSSMDNRSEFAQKLRSMLDFYRENRELIMMFQGAMNKTAAPEPAPVSAAADGERDVQKESRPAEQVDSMKILEEYLKRASV